jgi:PucR C-terminal helix-turn-helix domain
MGTAFKVGPESMEGVRCIVVEGLRARRPEIERAISDRIRDAVPYPVSEEDPGYEVGLLEAVASIVSYSLDALEQGPEWSNQLPAAATAQARRAARAGVSIGTVQRRYIAGHRELGNFVAQEMERNGFSNNGEAIHHLRTTQEALLEHLAATIEREYGEERESIIDSQLVVIVEKLLSGEDADSAELAKLRYEIDAAWHVGLIVSGPGAEAVIHLLRKYYARRLLCVLAGERIWGWVGTSAECSGEIDQLSCDGYDEVSISIGELARGLDGWCLTHNQALSAFDIAIRKPNSIIRYADDRLLAGVLQDSTLVSSLTHKYLVPLSCQSDGGKKLRVTLRTYINLECNATSASHPLRVGRHTVESRVHTVEQLIGCPLRECLAELDLALRLEELNCSLSHS